MADELHLSRHPRAAELTVQRAAVVAALRAWLQARDSVEAHPPPLAPHAGSEPHLHPPTVAVAGLPGRLWLQTSPELALKRLVCAGVTSVHALAHAFRGGREELGPQHQPQFLMLEWYRPGRSTDDLVADVTGLVGAAAAALGRPVPARPHGRSVSMLNAFPHLAHVDLEPLLDGDVADFAAAATAAGIPGCDEGQDAETLLLRVLIERIEPELRRVGGLVFLHDWPLFAGALAKPSATDPRLAQRVEAWLGGVELANGWVELDDAEALQARWEEDRAQREGEAPPCDEGLLADMREHGHPPTVGMALGVDRLLMALLEADTLADVLPLHLEQRGRIRP